MTIEKDRIKVIRTVLDNLARAEHEDNDTKEEIFDLEMAKIAALERTGILEAVRSAVGNNAKRQKYSPFVISELYDVQGSEEAFVELLSSADDSGRCAIIQRIGTRRLVNLIGALNRHFEGETDEFCKDQLLWTLGTIADESSLPIFEYLIRKPGRPYEWRILWAATRYAREEFRDYLDEVFSDAATPTTNKIIAAWGLARLGDSSAFEYLVSMLDDPEVRTANSYDPGHSLRAAQAIANINGWEFEWDKNSVALVKGRLRQ